MKGGIEWNLTISGAERYIKDIYLMLLSGEIHIYAILYKSCSIKQIIFNKYATISHGGVWETQVCSYYYLNLITFSFLIDIIDNIIYASGTCHQNSNQWQYFCHVSPSVSRDHCHWREFWSHDTDVYLT